jgi:hypothetical protein
MLDGVSDAWLVSLEYPWTDTLAGSKGAEPERTHTGSKGARTGLTGAPAKSEGFKRCPPDSRIRA